MSQIRLSTYVNFNGHAREALEFYHKVLGGTLDLRGSRLEVDGAVITATDGHPKYPPTVGDNMAIALSGGDANRITKVFTGLADGGTIKGPLRAQAGRGQTGYLVDRFGINWVVTIAEA
jgi:PhnB protein